MASMCCFLAHLAGLPAHVHLQLPPLALAIPRSQQRLLQLALPPPPHRQHLQPLVLVQLLFLFSLLLCCCCGLGCCWICSLCCEIGSRSYFGSNVAGWTRSYRVHADLGLGLGLPGARGRAGFPLWFPLLQGSAQHHSGCCLANPNSNRTNQNDSSHSRSSLASATGCRGATRCSGCRGATRCSNPAIPTHPCSGAARCNTHHAMPQHTNPHHATPSLPKVQSRVSCKKYLKSETWRSCGTWAATRYLRCLCLF